MISVPSPGHGTQQVEHVGADQGWIGVPWVLPVVVNLPTDAGRLTLLLGAPFPNGGVRVREAAVGTEVGGGGREARRE